ncbi:MAG: RHS repeat-associated core domain-containing protein [Polyangiaceae bacterium]
MPSTRRAKYWEAVTSLLCFAFGRFRASLRVQLATAGLVALITAMLVSACGSDGSSGSNDRHLTEHERVRANSVAITEIPPGTEFYLNDAQGTPLVVTATDGSVKERSNYHAYGLPRNQKGKRSDPFRYLGNERDRGSDLSDFKARPYRPELGIFLSVDPVALFTPEATIGKPGMLGPYAYTNGDPINQVDRDGRCGTPYAPPGAGCAQKFGPQLPPAAQKEMERGIMEGTMKALDVVATVDGGMAAVKIARILANPVARKAVVTSAVQGTKALIKRFVGAGVETTEAQVAPARSIIRQIRPQRLRPTEELASKSQAAKMSKLMGEEKGFGPFDPIEAVEHEGSYYIVDGHHRTAAAIRARLPEVPVSVRPAMSMEEGQTLIRDWSSTLKDKGF